jgi:hypothetical protein
MSVFIMTHAGTRVFCRSSFASRFFFAFDLLPIVIAHTAAPHKILFLCGRSGSTGSHDSGAARR